MDSKKLAQLIKIAVREEIKKQLPVLMKEHVKKEVKRQLNEVKKKENKGKDAFELANEILQRERTTNPTSVQEQVEDVRYTNDPLLNEILNETKKFSRDHYVNEGMGTGYETDERTMSFTSQNVAVSSGVGGMRQHFEQGMSAEFGNQTPSAPTKTGLGVKTGLAGLDRILNRDNTELVKRFKR